ncbi:TIGR03960 family B12-binding radical SAM protein [Coriobacteriia bacterium Es71-Z0120]|uniref:TIGR03960 family B12-binding radical SAM protein n=1 Tax=Parvivirga hydrogeniphila TaxID=2939460 RepID=UPI002260E121|nr:TIGR03960 family B12-binding radical SAM protein [Parvivirga hydrogeniphila]MCL4078967.1 TIGR03960 family B12-binding radical SAM protein [Parvivirga hydrogeniphila]
MSDAVREAVERLLPGVEQPSRYVGCEWNAIDRRATAQPYRAVLAYPDVYDVGMANQAIQILYAMLNALEGVACERVFVPWKDMADALRSAGVALYALESFDPVNEFDLVGITLPHELAYTNVLELLDLAGIPLHAEDRSDAHPLVVGGGPCAYNPEPLAPFFDAVLVGDGEVAAVEIVQTHRRCKQAHMTRRETLAELAKIQGVYVPSLGQHRVLRRAVADLDAHRSPACPVVPYTDVVHDRVAVEVLRGCARGCRFCQAGTIYRPVRERRPDSIVRDAMAALRCTGYDEVSLTSLSTADHSAFVEVLGRLGRRLQGTDISISVPSLRADALTPDVARLLGKAKRTGLTIAPEAGTQRLRDVINKNITEDGLLDTVARAFASGWRRVKLYFMIGLPTETDDDVAGIGELVGRVLAAARDAVPANERGSVRVGVSVSTFVPKPHTPFQWEAQPPLEEVHRRQELLRERMPRKGVELSYHDAEASFVEAVLACGGREVAAAVEAAWRRGARFDAWTEQFSLDRWRAAFEESGLDASAIANRPRDPFEPLPWSHISSGVSTAYLRAERERAFAGQTTPDCTFAGCTGCGVCGALGVSNVIAGGVRV